MVLAPTGVAALNIGGQTIHSFFNFNPSITVAEVGNVYVPNEKLYKNIDTIVIDEISMVRADLLDCVGEFLRLYGKKKRKPFGGIQMIFIGDLYQLPPVVTSKEKGIEEIYETPYFFSAKAFNKTEFEFVEFEKVYRQSDEEFLEILNTIRNNTVTDELIEKLNTRVNRDFEPNDNEFYIYLSTTNKIADKINNEKLSKLSGKEYNYFSKIRGSFDTEDLPNSKELNLKIGSHVMLVNNDSNGRWVNGDIGKIVDIQKARKKGEDDIICVELSDGMVVDVEPYTWELFKYVFDNESNQLFSESVGTFTQYPLRLAWAITAHKSQGLTFDKVIIDLSGGIFSHGQLYVALSRCRTLEGIVLKKPVSKKHVFIDRRVVKFLTKFQYKKSQEKISVEEKLSIILKAIKEGKNLEIVYLKASDVKTKGVVKPYQVGEMFYNGVPFLGLYGYCTLRKEERVFNVEKIIEIREV